MSCKTNGNGIVCVTSKQINAEEMFCLHCDGAGLVNNKVCKSCNGHGVVAITRNGSVDYKPTKEQLSAMKTLGGVA